MHLHAYVNCAMHNSTHFLCDEDVVNLQRERRVQVGGAQKGQEDGVGEVCYVEQIILLCESLWKNALVCGEKQCKWHFIIM